MAVDRQKAVLKPTRNDANNVKFYLHQAFARRPTDSTRPGALVWSSTRARTWQVASAAASTFHWSSRKVTAAHCHGHTRYASLSWSLAVSARSPSTTTSTSGSPVATPIDWSPCPTAMTPEPGLRYLFDYSLSASTGFQSICQKNRNGDYIFCENLVGLQ